MKSLYSSYCWRGEKTINRTGRWRHIFTVWTLIVDIRPQAQAFAFLASSSHGRFNLEFLLPWNPEHRVIWASNQLFWSFLAFHGQMFVKMVSLGGDVSESAASYPSTRNSGEWEGLTHENKGFHRLKIILLLYIWPSLHHMNTGHTT